MMRIRLLIIIAFMPGWLDASDGLVALSDEFDDAETLANWKRVYEEEGWGFDQLEQWGISDGQMTMIPHSSGWYNEWRGVHRYKEVTGDFVVTTRVTPRNRADTGAPGMSYSLAGIFVRTPRNDIRSGQQDWTANGQNYIFLSLGTADSPGSYQLEVKTTVNSNSTLNISSGAPSAIIQIARIGDVFITSRQLENGEWVVHRRYRRTDMPETLNVGLTCYTDWPTVSAVGYQYHNQNLLSGEAALPGGAQPRPDLVARFDYVRFQEPNVPASLAEADFMRSSEVRDADLLDFLGDHANHPPGSDTHWKPQLSFSQAEAGAPRSLNLLGPVGQVVILQSSDDLVHWEDERTMTTTGTIQEIVVEPGPVMTTYFRLRREEP
ncbi:MAG: hypothetical protein KDN22_13195 [Verrucomicrobiae bacterium]|nr:hypothetical protein [Verrucomicrobiae bacterium]